MFRGAAWFSSSVPRHVRRQWATHGGKKAGRGRDRVRRRLWYCFCNGSQDPQIADVRSRGLVAYHALWIVECVKQRRVLPMEDYVLDADHPRPGLDFILSTPKRRLRPLVMEPSTGSSAYSWGAIDKDRDSAFSDSQYEDPDFSIDHDLELGDVFYTTDRRNQPPGDPDNSSFLSWDLTPSLTLDLEDEEEMEQSRVEELVDAEMGGDKDGMSSDWSDMMFHPSNTILQSNNTPELDASIVLARLSEQYPHVLAGATRFLPLLEYHGKVFSATKTSVAEDN